MKTSIISPSILPSERQPKRGKTLIRTFTYLLIPVVLLTQIVLGFGFSPVVNLILQPVLMSRINFLWSSPCKHFFFLFLDTFFIYLFGEIYVFVTYVSKILFFQPWAMGSLNTSQLFQGHVEFIFPSWILTVHWARKVWFGFFCLTYDVNWNKNLKLFKLFVAECSSCFNEKVMQEKQGRVLADGGFRSPLTEESTQVLKFLGDWRQGTHGKCGPFSFHSSL